MRSLSIQDEVEVERRRSGGHLSFVVSWPTARRSNNRKNEKKRKKKTTTNVEDGRNEGETAGASRECGGSGDEEAMRVSKMKRDIEKEGSK